jgi:hypothetical protein
MNADNEGLRGTSKKATALLIAAALTIAGACLCAFLGLLGVLVFATYVSLGTFKDVTFYIWSFVGIFGLVAFVLGLNSGIMMLRRKHFWLSAIGVFFLLVPDSAIFLFSIWTYGGWILGVPYFGLLLSMTIGTFSILSLILIAISKREFPNT